MAWGKVMTRKTLEVKAIGQRGPGASAPDPPSRLPSPYVALVELSLAPPIQPRAAYHQEQGQEQLREQRQHRNRRGADDGHRHRIRVSY